MATFTAIKNSVQSGGSLGRALDYVKQEKKTLWDERQLITGWNCVAQSAYAEMMTTKRQYGKTDGRMFYQFVQSFDPAEDVSPQEVHAIGLELAQKLFPAFEVVVATHVDTDHLHNHLIINSVSWKDGHKLHQNAADLQLQRQISDEICMAHGLQVLEPPKKHTQDKKMRPGEYRSAVRGESWKFQLINTIDLCMRKAKTKDEFIQEMEKWSYQVRWEPTRQAITYTTPKGKKCRDNRLHENKYRKEIMELEFRIREAILYGRIEEAEPAAGNHHTPSLLPHRGTVEIPDEAPERSASTAGDPKQYDGGHVVYNAGTEVTDRGPDQGAADDPSAVGTGWEEERAAAFTAQDTPAPSLMDMAVGHSDYGELAHDLVRLGRTLEQSGDSPLPSVPVSDHIDRKRWAELQRKRIAAGHRADDHEEQTHSNLSQTM